MRETGVPSTGVPSDERSSRFVARVGRGVVVGGLVGVAIGLVLGLVLGFVYLDPGSPSFWAAVIAPTIFIGLVCTFAVGLAQLESPEPGREPSDTTAPLRDRRLTKDERSSASRG